MGNMGSIYKRWGSMNAKKIAAKTKPRPKPSAPPPAAPAEFTGEAAPHERGVGDRKKKSAEQMAAPSIYSDVTQNKPNQKIK
jgi:hypothetical protein